MRHPVVEEQVAHQRERSDIFSDVKRVTFGAWWLIWSTRLVDDLREQLELGINIDNAGA